jgi:phosphohistidine phosphatase SixA
VSVILLRHASAGDREAWVGDDRLRPLDGKGLEQARKLREQLLARGVTQAISSPYVRCVQTVEPLGIEIVEDERLAEGADLEEVLGLLRGLGDAVACTHGDVVFGVLGRPLRKARAAVLDGELREIETISP